MIEICMLIIILLLLYYRQLNYLENFSSSGLALSNQDCNQLAYIYNRPYILNQQEQELYRKKICDNMRRENIYYETGMNTCLFKIV